MLQVSARISIFIDMRRQAHTKGLKRENTMRATFWILESILGPLRIGIFMIS